MTELERADEELTCAFVRIRKLERSLQPTDPRWASLTLARDYVARAIGWLATAANEGGRDDVRTKID